MVLYVSPGGESSRLGCGRPEMLVSMAFVSRHLRAVDVRAKLSQQWSESKKLEDQHERPCSTEIELKGLCKRQPSDDWAAAVEAEGDTGRRICG